jgi:Protein of unknown function (DUF1778)
MNERGPERDVAKETIRAPYPVVLAPWIAETGGQIVIIDLDKTLASGLPNTVRDLDKLRHTVTSSLTQSGDCSIGLSYTDRLLSVLRFLYDNPVMPATKLARLNARATELQMDLIREAATRKGVSLSDFVLQATIRDATATLARAEPPRSEPQ